MRTPIFAIVFLCCSQIVFSQDIPQHIVVLKNGGFFHGRVIDSTSSNARILLYTTDRIQVSKSEIAGEYKLPEPFREKIRSRLLSPGGAAVMSLLFNGAGHLYVGEYTEAAIHIALQVCAGALILVGVTSQNNGFAYLGGGMMVLLKILAASDAWSTADQINQLRINRAIEDHIDGRGGPPLELSYDIVPIENGAAAGVQIRF